MAQFKYGNLLLNGPKGIRDQAQARKWFERASKAGFIKATYNLGHIHWNGLGVAENYKKAWNFFLTAAKGGNAKGMLNLGVMRLEGHYRKVDLVEAFKWGVLAKNLGAKKQAMELLAHLRPQMTKAQMKRADAAAQKWYDAHRR